MKRIVLSAAIVLLASGQVQAQVGLDLLGGFMFANKVFIESGFTVDDLSMKGGSSWGVGSLELWMGDRDSTMSAFGFSGSGFIAESSAPFLVDRYVLQAELDATVGFAMGWGRGYVSQPGLSRVFMELGLGYCRINADVKASIGLIGAEESIRQDEPCLGVGIGFQHRINKTFTLIGRGRYIKVFGLEGEFDPSNFSALIGIGIGG